MTPEGYELKIANLERQLIEAQTYIEQCTRLINGHPPHTGPIHYNANLHFEIIEMRKVNLCLEEIIKYRNKTDGLKPE